ncbi:hypothetical protein ACJ72_05185 [Emergomyces africanus]|uniref:Linalool dehydratase/isomerase domain-containing protein n=1 Tax=Emergomyces africanus TaxID=1955775 RepID=A0A1B7NUM6_9EURO|nr:hypothetical protein ACJ72_05185 [Emergomyces africanus]
MTTFPKVLPLDLSKFPKLSPNQAGHLRHFYNIGTSLDGDWPHMGTQDPDQAFLDAYRYQLATMVYAAGLAHYHHLPAMRSLFKPLIRDLIRKMLRNEVWSYWYLTSQSGNRLDPELKELRKPWADPIIKENIMYSGHLLLMTSLYAMLFNDDEFEKPGSLSFEWDPLFWGFGPEKFEYDNASLQSAILEEMERGDWVGVCCEPNLVFVVCNQFPLIAMRYNDVRHGTNVIQGVLEKYQDALKKKNMVGNDGLFVDWLLLRQGVTTGARGVGFTAWANAFMNAWNPTLIRSLYSKQTVGFLTTNISNGAIELQHPAIGSEIRRLAAIENADPNSPETIKRARDTYLSSSRPGFKYMQPHFGYVLKWLSELGKTKELNALLSYADERFQPTWEKGGLYYPRHDTVINEAGEWTFLDPFSGNAAIGYARLNVEDGQRKMWEAPWTKAVLAGRPWVDGLSLGHGVNCLRGAWVEEVEIDDGAKACAMIITLWNWEMNENKVEFVARGLQKGSWGVYERGRLLGEREVPDGGNIEVTSVLCSGEEVDIVLMQRFEL